MAWSKQRFLNWLKYEKDGIDIGGTGTGNQSFVALKIGDWVASSATTSAIKFSTDQNIYSDGMLSVAAMHGSSASDLTSAYNAHVLRVRHVAYNFTCNHESYGVLGQMVAKSVTFGHLHAGVMGTLEASTAVTNNGSYQMGAAAVIARVGGLNVITATKPVAGFLAFRNSSAAVSSGYDVAYGACCVSTSYPWKLGIYFPQGSVSTGIRIGDFASSGATTGGIKFSTVQDFWSDGQLDVAEFFGASDANLTSAYSAKCVRARHVVNCTTCAHETYGVVGQCVVKSTTLSHLHAGVMGTFEVQTACTVPTGGASAGGYTSACAVLARVGGATITVGATSLVAGVIAMSNNPTLSVTSGGVYAAFACVKNTTGFNTMLFCQDAETFAIFSAASDTYVHGIKAVAATPAGNTSHALKILIGTTAGYIPVYDNENF